MKKKKYLPLYFEWLEAGKLPKNGLCTCFGISYSENHWIPNRRFKDFYIIFPDDVEKSSPIGHYWGADSDKGNYHRNFGSLRQTIVLLMAAINGEL